MSRRRSYHLEGLDHKAPIPAAARVGNLLFSSAISGKDPSTGTHAPDPAAQIAFVFSHMAALVRDAGGDLDDIVRVTVSLRDREHKGLVDEQWCEMFPDPRDRPARHAVPLERAGKAAVQLEFVAVLSEGVP